MERPFICESDKYAISGNNTIYLPVSLENLPSKIVIDGNKLILKSSFHVSLVCINEIIRKHNISIPEFKDSVVKDFCDFVALNDINLLNYREEFKFVTKHDAETWDTVIVMCEVSNIYKFFEIINKKYGLEIEYPPTHVTLYTTESKAGIFLTDVNDIENLTKSIPNPIGHLL